MWVMLGMSEGLVDFVCEFVGMFQFFGVRVQVSGGDVGVLSQVRFPKAVGSYQLDGPMPACLSECGGGFCKV